MKTAISIPDDIFVSAEKMAKKLGIPRSRLFTRAIEEFLENHSKEKITKKLNKVYTPKSDKIKDVVHNPSIQILRESLKNDSW
ncbi:MAG: ribbon-helix-helix domain-containing protein [Spirochaetia bacterium]|nr:ribbon-helix-helix domain-containing protein [Spirochaetia bacterium]